MLDHAPAPLVGARRRDLPRAPSPTSAVPSLAPGLAALAGTIDRHLATGRRQQQAMAVLAVAVQHCTSADGQDLPELMEALAIECGQRLRSRVRVTDSVLWQGGREYAVVLGNCRQDVAQLVRRRLLTALGGPYRMGTRTVQATVAIGCACPPAAGDSGALLLDAALSDRGPLIGG